MHAPLAIFLSHGRICSGSMPKSFTVDIPNRLVISTYAGRLTFQDVIDQWNAIRAHPDFDPSFSYLTDLSELTEYLISTPEVRELARITDPFSPRSKRVVVAPSDHIFGVVRMYEMSSESHPNLVVFRTMNEANEFLHRMP